MTEDYKVGQKIVINTRHGELYSIQPPYKIEEITRVTATQIITSDGRRYMKSSRREFGHPRYSYSIAFNYFEHYGLMTVEEALKANQEWEKDNKIFLMRQFITGITWKEVPPEKIEQIYKILKGE